MPTDDTASAPDGATPDAAPLGASHVRVLLTAGIWLSHAERVEMPAALGAWSSNQDSWMFHLSVEGHVAAESIRVLSDAASAALKAYLDSGCERSECLPGAFRDGFSNGVAWARGQEGDS